MLELVSPVAGLQFILSNRGDRKSAAAGAVSTYIGSNVSSLKSWSSYTWRSEGLRCLKQCSRCSYCSKCRGRRKTTGILSHHPFKADFTESEYGVRFEVRQTELPFPGHEENRKYRSSLRCAVRDFDASTSANNDNHGTMELQNAMVEPKWTSRDSEILYRVPGWGAPYFVISDEGHACVRPFGFSEGAAELDLVELIESLKKRNVQLPFVIRFPSIVNHRIKQLQDSFDKAISNFGYKSHFQGVFPVKCNHDRYLVEEIVKFGDQYQFGLEAGSKPELLIAMAKLRRSRRALLICNGYKDKGYMESVLLARQLGIKAVIVLEQMEELGLIIERSKILGVKPLIGIRAKLSTKHSGQWGGTSGDKGKFGLTVNEIVRVVYTLKNENMLDCLQLLHFHIGSQVPAISIIKEAMREGSHVYCELALMGAPMGYIDVGGGLGIDYDGTKRQSRTSTNYSMQNYANDVIAALVDACLLKGVSHPIVVSESGRALASHHSVFVFEVLDQRHSVETAPTNDLESLAKCSSSILGNSSERAGAAFGSEPHKGEYLLSTFYEVYQSVTESNCWESFNDAKQFKLEASSLFKLGCLSLEQRAQANTLYEAVCRKVLLHANSVDIPEDWKSLRLSMGAVYHANMSLFRSAPDMWAISQVFPIIPLQRLNEKPTVEVSLADLTCDSDGKVDRFISANGEINAVLPVHGLRDGEPYYMGLFLAGVYQEIMGSAHNLFGATNIVHVRTKCSKIEGTPGHDRSGNGSTDGCASISSAMYTIDHVIKGQTMAEVLSTMQHDANDMMEELRVEAEDAVADGRLSLEDAQTFLRNYRRSLDSYTYLTREEQS